MSDPKQRLIWIDLEMTGLEPDTDRIIEMAAIITENDLTVVAESPVIAVHQSDDILNGMDEWNTTHHGESGLVDRVKASTYDDRSAELEMLNFLKQHVEAGAAPMAGNSICQDRRFMARWMPELEAFFHYRNFDVSAVKEMCKRWAPDIAAGVTKGGAHLAMDDIKDSIREMEYYREHFLKID